MNGSRSGAPFMMRERRLTRTRTGAGTPVHTSGGLEQEGSRSVKIRSLINVRTPVYRRIFVNPDAPVAQRLEQQTQFFERSTWKIQDDESRRGDQVKAAS